MGEMGKEKEKCERKGKSEEVMQTERKKRKKKRNFRR